MYMNPKESPQIHGARSPQWEVVSRASDGGELLKRTLSVETFAEAAQIATRLARVVDQYAKSDGAHNVQVLLSAWRVEILLAGVDRSWSSRSERDLADWIDQNLS